MSRNPRSAMPCRPPPRPRPGPHSTIEAGATATLPQAGCRPRPPRPQTACAKSTIPKRGPPPAPPKKVDYKRPTMTRAMEQRIKHTQRLQEQMERRERERAQAACPPPRRPRLRSAQACERGRTTTRRPAEDRGCRPSSRAPESRPTEPSTCCPSGPAPPPPPPPPPCPPPSRATSAGPSRPRSRTPAGVPERTINLAKSMNAEVVKAEPLESGPIDNLIIPPGAINSEKTTVISIPQPGEDRRLPSSTLAHNSGAAGGQNRSVQVISESLDEQDAAEATIVNSKLQDLQQARRDFVMAVANVGGNVINLQDDDFANVTPIASTTPPPPPMIATPESSSPRLIPCPDLEDPYLQVEYGRHHPVVEEAREYLRRREAERYENFSRCTRQPIAENDYLNQEYLEVSDLEDNADPCQYTPIPRRNTPYHYLPMQVERLERFFDLQHFPPQPRSPTPPPAAARAPLGRECLPQELWELEDPWYQEPEVPDLIDWNNNC